MHRLRNLLSPLRVFDAVSRTGGVSVAARALSVTPSAVSQQLKQLEDSLGLKLLTKNGREVRLTDTGRQLAHRIGDAFDRIERALTEAEGGTNSNVVRLKVAPGFAIRWLLPRLADFYAHHDDIEVTVGTTSKRQDIQLDELDFIINHGTGAWPGVASHHLFDDEFVPVCSPAVAAGIRKPRDLLEAKLLHSMMRSEAWKIWLTSAGMGDAMLSRSLTFSNVALSCQAALDGLGVAMAHASYVREDVAAGRLVIPVPHVARTSTGFFLSWDPARGDSRGMKAFREWVVRHAEADRNLAPIC